MLVGTLIALFISNVNKIYQLKPSGMITFKLTQYIRTK